MPKSTRQEIEELDALNDAISAELPAANDPRYAELVTARALVSIASSLAVITLHGIETSSKD